MCEDFTPNFDGKRTGCCITTTHRLAFSFSPVLFLTKINMTLVAHLPFFSVSPIEDNPERQPFWHNWGDRGRIAGGAEHPHRTWLPGCI
jgi:hypothetical protein